MIVSVSGPAGSGKSLIASMLAEHHGFRVVSFAEPLKRVAQMLWGFTDHQLFGPSSARSEPHPHVRMPDGQPLTARVALQVLGTDVARKLDQDVWVRVAMRDIRDDEDVVVPDCRYISEMDALRDRGAKFIRRTSRGPISYDSHASEREMMDVPDSAFDAIIRYDDNLDRLRHTVSILVWAWRQT